MSGNLPPSFKIHATNWFSSHWASWLILLIGLCILIYTLKVIASEKSSYHEDGSWINWKFLVLFIPAWWSKIEDQEELRFHRSDTHYDWYFSVQIIKQNCALSAKDNYLQQHQIVLDEDCVHTKQASFVLKNPETLKEVLDFYRIESTATEKEQERIYLDCCWIKFRNEQIIQLISKSSVLNGGIEGPYAEEVLKEIKFIKNT